MPRVSLTYRFTADDGRDHVAYLRCYLSGKEPDVGWQGALDEVELDSISPPADLSSTEEWLIANRWSEIEEAAFNNYDGES